MTATQDKPEDTKADAVMGTRNRRLGLVCASVAVGMIGLAYASVPLYSMFCRVTGFGGTTQRAVQPASTILDHKMTVRFDANVGDGLPWDFVPISEPQTLKIGENGLAFYRVTNRSKRTIIGTATYNVTPEQAGIYFNKLACFCFTEQHLDPGESLDLPVSYYIDPEIMKDIDASRLTTITLSYTFYEAKKPAAARADTDKAKDPTGKPEAGTKG
ncbi:MAG: cytochrome c oxidase assembly protein [Hyphomicrobiaceae bacterium]